jgi:hypothetical protein
MDDLNELNYLDFSNDLCQPSLSKKRGRLRRACNSCSRIKKKCDGNRPCTLCVKSKLECKYEERIRPGPSNNKTVTTKSTNTSGSNSSSSTSSTTSLNPPENYNNNNALSIIKPVKHKVKIQKQMKQLTLSNQSLLTSVELTHLSTYVDNINTFLPILSKLILQESLTVLSREANNVFDNSIETIAKVCLAWCSCTIISYIKNDASFSLYLSYTYSYVRRLLDGTSIYVTKALIAYEILLLICVNQSNVDICKGSYYQLGENIYKIKNYNDYSIQLLYNYYHKMTMKTLSNRLLSIQKLWLLSNTNPLSTNTCPVK